MATKSNPAQQAQSSVANVGGNDLSLAVNAIFESDSTDIPLIIGGKPRIVQIKPARMKTLSVITNFFDEVLGRLNQKQIEAIVNALITHQRKKIAAGEDPNQIDLSILERDDIVEKAFGNASILLTLFGAASDGLPKVVEVFSNVSAQEYEDFDIEVGVVIATAIFVRNYSFFSRNLLPTLLACLKSWASLRLQSASQSD